MGIFDLLRKNKNIQNDDGYNETYYNNGRGAIREVFDQINLNPGGVIVTAKGDHCDFVSRFFTPQATILEDPVTGSAHCTLTPYWSNKVLKKRMNAQQISERKGELICELKKDRVEISGKAITYFEGYISL